VTGAHSCVNVNVNDLDARPIENKVHLHKVPQLETQRDYTSHAKTSQSYGTITSTVLEHQEF
jgi:hypothetical protein